MGAPGVLCKGPPEPLPLRGPGERWVGRAMWLPSTLGKPHGCMSKFIPSLCVFK